MEARINPMCTSIPTMTKLFLLIILGLKIWQTFYDHVFPIGRYLILKNNLAYRHFQLWRLFTNLIFQGKIYSSEFILYISLVYCKMSKLEIDAKTRHRYSEFIMMLFYIGVVVNALTIMTQFCCKLNEKESLWIEFIFALFCIDCFRDPEVYALTAFLVIKNAYGPYFFMLFILLNGDANTFYSLYIGYFSGYLYYYFKEIVPIHYNINIFKNSRLLELCFDMPRLRAQLKFKQNHRRIALKNYQPK